MGSENLLQLLSEGRDNPEDYTRFLINSQVVPSYEDTSIPAVREYRELMARHDPKVPGELVREPYSPFPQSFVSLEGFLDAKLMTEILRRLGERPDRAGLEGAVFSVRDFDLGIGEQVSFGPVTRVLPISKKFQDEQVYLFFPFTGSFRRESPTSWRYFVPGIPEEILGSDPSSTEPVERSIPGILSARAGVAGTVHGVWISTSSRFSAPSASRSSSVVGILASIFVAADSLPTPGALRRQHGRQGA